jgi:hypothetical protein
MSVIELIDRVEHLSPEDLAKFWSHWGIEPSRVVEPPKPKTRSKEEVDEIITKMREIAARPSARAFAKAWGNDIDGQIDEMRNEW